MAVCFNSNVSFRADSAEFSKAENTENITVKNAASAPSYPNDAVEIAKKQKKKRYSFKDFIADTAKFFVTTTEMVKGTFKGIVYGLTVGVSVLGVSLLFGTLPKAFRNGTLKEALKSPIKSMGTKSKVLAGAAALGIGTYHFIAAKLKANQRTANVDHQLKTGHRDV